MTEQQLIHALDLLLVKFFAILFSAAICWYFISRISYGGKN